VSYEGEKFTNEKEGDGEREERAKKGRGEQSKAIDHLILDHTSSIKIGRSKLNY
jgi:hypothetical protein